MFPLFEFLFDIDIDDMPPELWRLMTPNQRKLWTNNWYQRGQSSFTCRRCGFPTPFGQYGCVACRSPDENALGILREAIGEKC